MGYEEKAWKIFSRASPLTLAAPQRAATVLAGGSAGSLMRQAYLISDFLQLIVIRAVPSLAASTQKLRDLDLCLLSSASLSKHGKIERL